MSPAAYARRQTIQIQQFVIFEQNLYVYEVDPSKVYTIGWLLSRKNDLHSRHKEISISIDLIIQRTELKTVLTEQTLHGVWVPIVTPFDRRGRLDTKSIEMMVLRLSGKGIRGFIVNGITGESPAITSRELELVIGATYKALAASRSVPLVVGTGSNHTSTAFQTIELAWSLGADAALVAAPLCDRPSQRGIIQHFQALAGAGLPIIVHDYPHPTGMTSDLETMQSVMEMDHVIGLKDNTGNMKRIARLARSMTKPVLCGDDELFFASLCCGAQGGIIAGANLDSEQFAQVYELFRAGDINASKQRFDELLPLVRFLHSEPSPALLKWLLAERRYIRSDRLRLPAISKKRRAIQ